jgi:cytochrome c oxidase subunit 2
MGREGAGSLQNSARAGKWMRRISIGSVLLGAGALLGSVATATADEVLGYARPGQIDMQPAVTPIAHEMHYFHDVILLPIIIAISLLVLALLLVCILRFNEKVHPVPSKTTHNAMLEVAWTIVPVLLLVIIAIPSFRLLTNQLVIPKPDITLKATGKQWYWSYTYPKDQAGGFEYDSALVPDEQLKPGDLRLLTVDNEAVVPVNKVVAVQVTGADVIHSFIVQSLGVRMDAVPGRMNETWFKAEREGVYYGQCSKLCGKDHAYMPIVVRVVSQPQYEAWLQDAKKKFADSSDGRVTVAANTDINR